MGPKSSVTRQITGKRIEGTILAGIHPVLIEFTNIAVGASDLSGDWWPLALLLINSKAKAIALMMEG